ncbi:MAG: BON domain-containing protein [Pseudomonadota bacterium]
MNKLIQPLVKGVLCAALLGSLSGCIGLVVGGAVAGAVSATDRRTLGAQTDDKSISYKAEMKLPELVGKYGHINVNSYNRQVLLTGEVKDEAMKSLAEREVRTINGVASVANELQVADPATYTSRSNDSLITTKVKASLVDMKTISAASFKVITERGVVYMMGRVTQREGQVGADVARGVSGVSKVVKVFDYITEDELRALSPNAKVEL